MPWPELHHKGTTPRRQRLREAELRLVRFALEHRLDERVGRQAPAPPTGLLDGRSVILRELDDRTVVEIDGCSEWVDLHRLQRSDPLCAVAAPRPGSGAQNPAPAG